MMMITVYSPKKQKHLNGEEYCTVHKQQQRQPPFAQELTCALLWK